MKVEFLADMKDGVLLESPVTVVVESKQTLIIGVQTLEEKQHRFKPMKGEPYLMKQCRTVRTNLFVIRYDGHDYGSKSMTKDGWLDKIRGCCPDTGLCCDWLSVNGCYLIVNGKRIII